MMWMPIEKLQDNAGPASVLLKAMSNKHRLMILCKLVGRERCVNELEGLIGLSQSALSQHLARLRRDCLVKTRRSAQTIFYSLAGGEAQTVLDALCQIYGETAPLLPYAANTEFRKNAAIS
jgi:DNA-binding transcriptional ArsR family regulator